MKRWLWVSVFLCSAIVAWAAEETFSRAVRPDDFNAAGLSKLTPEELSRLDRLVRDYKSGALAAARKEVAAAEAKAAKAEADARAADAFARAAKSRLAESAKKPAPSPIERPQVLLKPGTRVEYSTLESRLTTDFTGWERGTFFHLENGQTWRAVEGEYVTPPMPAPRVKIEPGLFGTFWMTIEGVRQRVKVESLDAK